MTQEQIEQAITLALEAELAKMRLSLAADDKDARRQLTRALAQLQKLVKEGGDR